MKRKGTDGRLKDRDREKKAKKNKSGEERERWEKKETY